MHVEMPPIDDDNMSIHSRKELARFESLRMREFSHTRVYDVSYPSSERGKPKLPYVCPGSSNDTCKVNSSQCYDYRASDIIVFILSMA
jgi:hypothetical protein